MTPPLLAVTRLTAAALLAAGTIPLLFADDAARDADGFVALFPNDGAPDPAQWTTGLWSDVSQPAPEGAVWEVRDGVLLGGKARGSWLMSRREYGNFILEFEFKLGPRGNSGCALRAPLKGDPAFDGMEIQMADFRYNTEAKPSELTGGIYRAIAPREQVYKPEEWNRYRIELDGTRLRAELNGTLIHDLDLADHGGEVLRHDGKTAPSPKDRPAKGHIGFQELSRDGDRVMVRGARIKELPAE